MTKSYKELMSDITTFVFDVDGVLTNGGVTIFPNGELIRTMNTRDGYALKVAVDCGYNVCIITGGNDISVQKRLNGLGIKDVYLGAHNKVNQFEDYLNQHNLKAENVLYMGDDIPDYPVMLKVKLAACPKDAAQEIQNISHYISQKKGGNGCVRDVIEQVLKVQDKWHNKTDISSDL
ncbi:MAG: HAD-IIIA family hydrolase [Flavobacteriales bacterium]|jgi:3-deoxy-D-manno-octulosonate 8-phosphate phosphatase (KDO 8-P phosphatase)|nr:HAD-IIIA family hydrolase [Flavobacteriales bacterium]